MFSGAHKRAELLHNQGILGVPNKIDKIESGCLSTAFSGAHKRAELLRNPCVLRDIQKGVQKGPSLGKWKKAHKGGR